MAIALVAQAAAGSADANTVTTAGVDTTGATLGIIAIGSGDNSATPTDSKGNTWTALTNQAQGPDMKLWYSILTSVGSGHTVTYTQTGSFPSVEFFTFSGTAASSVFDNSENGFGHSGDTSANTGSVTPGSGASNDLFFTGITFDTSIAGMAINSSFILAATGIDLNPGASYGIHAAYKIATVVGSENPLWSWTNSQALATRIATFKASAADTLLGQGVM